MLAGRLTMCDPFSDWNCPPTTSAETGLGPLARTLFLSSLRDSDAELIQVIKVVFPCITALALALALMWWFIHQRRQRIIAAREAALESPIIVQAKPIMFEVFIGPSPCEFVASRDVVIRAPNSTIELLSLTKVTASLRERLRRRRRF